MESRKEPAPHNDPANPTGTPRQTLGPGLADNPYQPPFGQSNPSAGKQPAGPVPASPQGKRTDWPAVEREGFRETRPECASLLSHESACVICHACGYSQCG